MRFAHGGILSLLLAVALMAGSSSAQLADKKTLTLAIAKQIAAAVSFLAGPQASQVNGQTIAVDGGASLAQLTLGSSR